MSIKKKQITRVANKIIRRELQLGHFPSKNKILSNIEQYLKLNALGKPTANMYYASENSQVSTKDYSDMLEGIEEDLAILYQEAIEQSNRLTLTNLRFNSGYNRLNKDITRQADELRNLLLVANNSNDYIYSAYDYFNDLSKVNTIETKADIQNKAVTISQDKNDNKKADLSNSMLSFSPHNEYQDIISISPNRNISTSQEQDSQNNLISSPRLAVTEIIDVNPIFDDNIDTAWRYRVTTRESGSYGVTIKIILEEPIKTNKINISMLSPKKTNTTVRYSPDDINWFNIKSLDIETSVEIDTELIVVSQLELILSKSEPDITEYQQPISGLNVISYTYAFGIIDLSMFKLTYRDKGMFQSIEHEILTDIPIEKMSLWADEYIPPGGDIQYKIRVDDGDWVKISPFTRRQPRYNTVIALDDIEQSTPVTLEMSPQEPISEYEVFEYRAQGMKFYKLGTVPHSAIPSSIRLHKGKNMREVSIYEGNIIDDAPDNIGVIINNISPLNINYVSISEEMPSLLLHDTFDNERTYRFSTTFYLENKQHITTSPVCTSNISIYLNSKNIYSGMTSPGTEVNYDTKQGWNTIDVFVHIPADITVSTDISLDLLRYTSYIYASRDTLDRVSLFDLQYHIKYNNKDKFAAVVKDDKTDIILNHHVLGVPFDIFYKYATGTLNTVALKADITRSDASEISPKIKGYQIRFV